MNNVRYVNIEIELVCRFVKLQEYALSIKIIDSFLDKLQLRVQIPLLSTTTSSRPLKKSLTRSAKFIFIHMQPSIPVYSLKFKIPCLSQLT